MTISGTYLEENLLTHVVRHRGVRSGASVP